MRLVCAAVSGAALGATCAAAGEAPVFTTFKTLCIDTGAVPEAVRKAVEAAGGKPELPLAAPTPGEAASLAVWDVDLDGASYRVQFGDTQSPSDSSRGVESQTCNIDSATDDEAGIAEARRWVGVPPSHSFSDVMFIEVYDFQQNGPLREPLPADQRAFHSLELAGQVWALGLKRSPQGTSMMLAHSVPLRPTR